MNRILIAAVAALSFAGVASAQQAPSSQTGSTRVGAQSQFEAPRTDGGVDFTTTGSIDPDRASSQGGYGANVTKDDLHR